MAVSIEIDSNLKDVSRDVMDVMNRQVPFAVAGAVQDTVWDIRRRIVFSTYQKAFEVKNKRWPGVLFKILDEQGAPFRSQRGGVARAFGRDLRSTGSATVSVGEVGGDKRRDWLHLQTFGGTKKPRGTTIAVPANKARQAELRTTTGRVKASKKPLRITNVKHTNLVGEGANKRFIIRRRKGGDPERIYNFARQAKIKPTFRFFPDAHDTFNRVFDGHFAARFSMAMRTRRRR